MLDRRSALALLLLTGCRPAREEVPTETFDLLTRHPDAIEEQVGSLRPNSAEQWVFWGRIGWEDQTHETPDGRTAYVWSKDKDACLRLDAGPQRDRSLDFALWVWNGESTDRREVQVFLNDELLDTIHPTGQPGEFHVPAPARVWNRGRNILRLSVDRLTQHPTGTWLGVALGDLRYDETHSIRCEPRQRLLVLQTDTSVRYDLEPGQGSTLRVGASASGEGVLELVLSAVDRESGDPRREILRRSLPVSARAIEQELAADVQPSEGLLSLQVGWSSMRSAELTLSRLELSHEHPRPHPPIVLIAVDTLSAKNLSLYGYSRLTSPALDRLAGDSIVFQRCATNATWTVPSMMSMLTGLFANSHRLGVSPNLQQPQVWEQWLLATNRWTLAESLRSAGYDTAAFVDSLWITPRFGFSQGFESFDWSAGEIDKVDPSGGIRHVTQQAREWLGSRPAGRPFFLFLHCFDVHGPYSPDEAHRGLFRDDELFAQDRELPAGGVPNVFGIVPQYITTAEYAGDRPARVSAARLRAAYDEGIHMVDEELGRFFDWLRERGLYDETLIVVTADHGETLDSGPYYFGHGVLDDEVVHVPLVVKLPGQERAKTSVARTVQSVDLYPTIQELAGVTPHAASLHGRSLVPLLRGEALPAATQVCNGGIMTQFAVERDGWRLVVRLPGLGSGDELLLTSPCLREIYARETQRDSQTLGPELVRFWNRTGVLLQRLDEHGMTPELLEELRRDPAWPEDVKLLRTLLEQPRYRLYYLQNDPLQRTDLAAERPEKVQELLELAVEAHTRSDRARAMARPPTKAVRLSQPEINELGKLGYVEGESE
jgi:arylsulfatase